MMHLFPDERKMEVGFGGAAQRRRMTAAEVGPIQILSIIPRKRPKWIGFTGDLSPTLDQKGKIVKRCRTVQQEYPKISPYLHV
jgi:hypothetical protein